MMWALKMKFPSRASSVMEEDESPDVYWKGTPLEKAQKTALHAASWIISLSYTDLWTTSLSPASKLSGLTYQHSSCAG